MHASSWGFVGTLKVDITLRSSLSIIMSGSFITIKRHVRSAFVEWANPSKTKLANVECVHFVDGVEAPCTCANIHDMNPTPIKGVHYDLVVLKSQLDRMRDTEVDSLPNTWRIDLRSKRGQK